MKTQFRLKIVLALLAFALLATVAGCGSSSDGTTPTAQAATGENLEGKITVSGAFALYPMMQMWAEEFTKLHPDVKFDVSAGGAGKGMTDALSGAVDIGMVAGAGSEMIGAGLAGWGEIQGIEMKDEYQEIAEARLKHWLNSPRQLELLV